MVGVDVQDQRWRLRKISLILENRSFKTVVEFIGYMNQAHMIYFGGHYFVVTVEAI